MKLIVAAIVISPLFTSPIAAQYDAAASNNARVLAEANRLGREGQVMAARRLTDSLARNTANDANDFADILLARATFASTMVDASADYETIITRFPRTAAAKASLLRLAQRALVSADPATALSLLQRVISEHPDDASVAEAQYWRARALLDARDVTAACAANREAKIHADAVHSPLAAAIESQRLVSCGESSRIQIAPQPKMVIPKATSATGVANVTQKDVAPRREYSVQVAAFDVRRDASEMADRLKNKGLDAHVDGSVKPFRVRIGHYATYADAAKAMRDLKSRKISGFVSESNE